MERKHTVSTKKFNPQKFNNLKEIIENVKKNYGDEPAFRAKTAEKDVYNDILYKDYIDNINALGTALISVGLKGQRIGVIGENKYEWQEAYLSIVCGVGVVVPLDKALPENEIYSLIERSGIEAIFYSEKFEPIMKKIKEEKIGNIKYFISMEAEETVDNVYSQRELVKLGKDLMKNGAKSYTEAKINNEEMSIMLFTSGTTAKSKAVMLSHKNICTNIYDISCIFNLGPGDLILSFLPLHHTFECTVGFLYPMSAGTTIAFCGGLRHIAEDLKDYHATAMIAVPILFESLYKRLMKEIDKKGQGNKVKFGKGISNILRKAHIDIRKVIFKEILDSFGGKIRLLVCGGAAYSPEVEKGLLDIGIPTFQGYGLTETSPVIAAESLAHRKNGSIGKLLPSVQGIILDPDEQGIGELAVKGDSVMLGYYENDEANKEVFTEDGYFKTGDLAYFDKDDYLFITGRKKSVIVLKNGKNIYPEELEVLINSEEGVKESFVYGKPDEEDKDDLKICAKIVYDSEFFEKKGLTDVEEIKQELWNKVKVINKGVPTYKYIKEIQITTEELIKTTTLKIKRYEEIKRV